MGQSPPGETVSYDDGFPLLNGPTEFGDHSPSPVQFTTDPRRFAIKGDILFCVRGSTTGRMNWADQDYAIGRGIAAIRHKEASNFQHFLRGAIEHHLPALLNQATGSTFPNVSRDQLRNLPFPDMPIETQEQVSSALKALDDRIELNRRMCATLEEMASAMFKAWFVDFEPVRAKIEGRWREGESLPGLPAHLYDLFPDEFSDSELGPVPSGWSVGNLSDVIEVNPTTKGARPEHYRYVAMASIPTVGPFVRDRIFRDKATGCRYRNGDALIARITPCLENGKTAFVDFLDHDEIGCGSTELLVLRARETWPPVSAYLFAKQQQFRDYAVANMVGSSGRQRVSANVIGQFRTVLPPDDLMYEAAPALTAMFRRGSEAAFQNVCLLALREALLPKLISGEVRLPDIAGVTEC